MVTGPVVDDAPVRVGCGENAAPGRIIGAQDPVRKIDQIGQFRYGVVMAVGLDKHQCPTHQRVPMVRLAERKVTTLGDAVAFGQRAKAFVRRQRAAGWLDEPTD